jgi:DNA-binding response OmpR family regulator
MSQLALIIEDDPDLSTIFGSALKAAGFQIEVIRDGALALERLSAVVPAVVVLDLHLPEVAGTDILAQIRADSRLTDTRIIIASADSRLAESLRDQSDIVLLKPISFSQLRDLSARLRM